MKDTFKPRQIGIVEYYYGTDKINSIIPNPKHFQNLKSKYIEIAKDWFENGLHKDLKITPQINESKETIIKHLNTIINTYFLPKTIKINAVAYLLDLWCSNAHIVK